MLLAWVHNAKVQQHPLTVNRGHGLGTKAALLRPLKWFLGKLKILITKAELLQEGIFFLIHLFARDVLVMKKSKPTFITSVLKVEY